MTNVVFIFVIKCVDLLDIIAQFDSCLFCFQCLNLVYIYNSKWLHGV